MHKYQSISKYDLEYINEVYLDLSKTDESPFESIKNYFQTFFDTHFEKEGQTELTPLQAKWKILLDWVISEMPKEICIKWIDYNDDGMKTENTEFSKRFKLIDIKLIDIDMKIYSKICHRHKMIYKYIMNYMEFMLYKKI